jgi:hypothetical protein
VGSFAEAPIGPGTAEAFSAPDEGAGSVWLATTKLALVAHALQDQQIAGIEQLYPAHKAAAESAHPTTGSSRRLRRTVRQARNGVDTHREPNSIVRVDESGSEPFSFGRR